jgi:hypothetical protein
MYWNGQFNIDDWNDTATYAVLDDFNIKFLPNYKFWFGAQKSGVLTDKYRKKRTVKWGRPLIWVGNDDPRRADTVDAEWMLLNTIFIEITEPLFE